MWDEVRTLLARLHKQKLEADAAADGNTNANADVDNVRRLIDGGYMKQHQKQQHSQSSSRVVVARSKADTTNTASYHHRNRSSGGDSSSSGGGKDGFSLGEVKIESAACRYVCDRYDGRHRVAEVAMEHVVMMIELVISIGLKKGGGGGGGDSQVVVRAAADLAQLIGHRVYIQKLKDMLRKLKHTKMLKKGKWQVLLENCRWRGLSSKKELYYELIKVW